MARAPRRQANVVDDDANSGDGEHEAVAPYVAKTPLGRKLMELHAQIAASGQPLLESWEDLEREIAERRGGLRDDGGL